MKEMLAQSIAKHVSACVGDWGHCPQTASPGGAHPDTAGKLVKCPFPG